MFSGILDMNRFKKIYVIVRQLSPNALKSEDEKATKICWTCISDMCPRSFTEEGMVDRVSLERILFEITAEVNDLRNASKIRGRPLWNSWVTI